MSTITWLHLSDLHFREDVQHLWDENVVLKALLTDVREQVEKGDLRPQFIVVSGDLAHSGKAGEYKLVGAFLDALLEAIRLKRECLFIVPGNHDVNLDNRAWGAKTLAAALTSRDAVRGALDDEASRQLLLAALRDYAAFVNGFLGNSLGFQEQPLWSVREIPADEGRKVSVLCLNSAWLANGGVGDRARLALCEYQVRAAVEAIANADLRIALMHHSFEWLADFDRNHCEPLLMNGCDFILHGHLHRTGLLSLNTPDAGAMVIAAGATYLTREHANAYNWVQLDLDSGHGEVHLRAYSDKGVAFWTKDVSTYKNVQDGAYPFTLSRFAQSRQEVPAAPVIPARLSDEERRRHEANYLRYVQRTCNAVPLHIIDPRAAARTMQQTVELAQIYVGLSTTAMKPDSEEKRKGHRAESVWEPGGREKQPISALEAADKDPAMVLLGDPGSGKSSFVSFLALCLAGARLEEMGEHGAPLSEAWLARLSPVWTRGALLPLV